MKHGPYQDMNDAWFTQQIWKTVPEYMITNPRHDHASDQAIAYVIGVRSFPARVVEFLIRAYSL